jgi:adenylylsulfate kinase
MYKKARNGELESFTGISSPYEVPENPNLILDTENHAIQECLNQLVLATTAKMKLN